MSGNCLGKASHRSVVELKTWWDRLFPYSTTKQTWTFSVLSAQIWESMTIPLVSYVTWTTPITLFFLVECGMRFASMQYADTLEVSPDNIVRLILRSGEKWRRITHYILVLSVAKKIELHRWRELIQSNNSFPPLFSLSLVHNVKAS